jgi:predicted hotdog family 3-hydroxylacyl-ACP dehydratase
MTTELKPCLYPIDRLLPHAAPMILIDEVIGWNPDQVVTGLTVRRDSAFAQATGMPAHVALEWMAQSCAALVGLKAIAQGEPVRIGFLLGTRDFRATLPWFDFGDSLTVTAVCAYNDGEMAQFDCRLDRAVETCASARLTVFQPRDLKQFLGDQGLRSAGSLT